MGWKVIRAPMPPEDDKPWTIFVKPNPATVRQVLAAIIIERAAGRTILIHCVHGRDRTSLVSSIAGMALYKWSRARAWKDMLAHGFRWELPDLDAYWLVDVP
jgi:protein-tyrosine phosphatase